MARKDSIDHDVTASLSGTVCSLKSNYYNSGQPEVWSKPGSNQSDNRQQPERLVVGSSIASSSRFPSNLIRDVQLDSARLPVRARY